MPELSKMPNPDKPGKCLKCAKMPKIVVSLQASPSATTRQVAPSLLYASDIFSMKIGHGSNSGIQGFRNLGIKGILSLLIY